MGRPLWRRRRHAPGGRRSRDGEGRSARLVRYGATTPWRRSALPTWRPARVGAIRSPARSSCLGGAPSLLVRPLRSGRRSPACACAATPSGLIGPTRREDRSIGSSRRRGATIAPRRTLRPRRVANRRRIALNVPLGNDLVGRPDGEAPKSKRRRRGIGSADAIGIRARNAGRVGREAFRPQRGSASPPVAKPFGRDCSRPSSGMAAHARARL